MKVLLSAYACEPGKGSEPGIGWNWVQQVARFHDVWVITRANNRPAIDKALAATPQLRVKWIYFDMPGWLCFWKRGQRGVHAYYYLWQLGIYFVARRLHREIDFDLAHHVTLGNYWMPSLVALLPLPFVWGPVGGGESAPRTFFRSFGLRGQIYELARDVVRALARFDPFVRLTARPAALALATTEATEIRLRDLGCRRVSLFSRSELSSDEIAALRQIPARVSGPFRVVSIGNLLHLKGFYLGMEAFARFQRSYGPAEYWLFGDGPERKRLERLAEKLGVADRVTFWGKMPRADVLARLSECDVGLHPSLHDSAGSVCLEAMAAGRPVVCLDLGGPAIQVSDESGIKVSAHSPEQTVRELASALELLACNLELRARLGAGGRRRVASHFACDAKGEAMRDIYAAILRAPCVSTQETIKPS